MRKAGCPKIPLLKILERGIEANTAATRPHGVGGWAKRHRGNGNRLIRTRSQRQPTHFDPHQPHDQPLDAANTGVNGHRKPQKFVGRCQLGSAHGQIDPSKRPHRSPSTPHCTAIEPINRMPAPRRDASMPMVMLVVMVMVIAARGEGWRFGILRDPMIRQDADASVTLYLSIPTNPP